jgi:F-type H+-transporting ATPase subunit epsilon
MKIMRLLLTSLGSLVVDHEPIVALRASDASGGFGLLPGHADFLTALGTGIVSWRYADGSARYCAVRGGVLSVAKGTVSVATRDAILDDNLEHLEATALSVFRTRDESERQARSEDTQLELKALRELMRYLQPTRTGTSS